MVFIFLHKIKNLQINRSIHMVSISWLNKIPAVRSATNLLVLITTKNVAIYSTCIPNSTSVSLVIITPVSSFGRSTYPCSKMMENLKKNTMKLCKSKNRDNCSVHGFQIFSVKNDCVVVWYSLTTGDWDDRVTNVCLHSVKDKSWRCEESGTLPTGTQKVSVHFSLD